MYCSFGARPQITWCNKSHGAKTDLDSGLNTFHIQLEIPKNSLKMNPSKTKAMWIGASKTNLDKPFGLEWCTCVKALGIYVYYYKEIVAKKNFQDILVKVQATINVWKMRRLSLHGKATIIKSFLIPIGYFYLELLDWWFQFRTNFSEVDNRIKRAIRSNARFYRTR